MLDILSKIVAFLAATIEAGKSAYDVAFKVGHRRKQEYYECLLKPFVVAYKNDKEISAIRFVRSKVNRDNDSIPKYVFYLIDQQTTRSKEMPAQQDLQKQSKKSANIEPQDNDNKLKKVLIDDYLKLYANDFNRTRKSFEILLKLLRYVMIIVVVLLMFEGAWLIATGLLSLIFSPFSDTIEITRIGNWEFNKWQWSLLEIIVGTCLSFVGLIPLEIFERISNDMYTIKRKRIQKIIEKKVRSYEDHQNEYVI